MHSQTIPEGELIRAAVGGDRSSLVELVGRYEETIVRFGRALCRNEEDAADVLQDTMMVVVEKLGDYRGAAAFSSWLYTIVRSQCGRKRRKYRREILGTDSNDVAQTDVPDARPLPVDVAEDAESLALLRAAIDSLEPMYREVLMLRDVEGWSAPQVAAALDLTVEAVKSRLHRARAFVREHVAAAERSPARSPDPRCPDIVAILSQHLEGDLTGIDCSQMEAHLSECPMCRMACDGLKQTLARCALEGARPVSPEARLAVTKALENVLANSTDPTQRPSAHPTA